MYKLIVAKMYSSGDRVFIISWVSKMMKSENTNAPPNPIAISKMEDCRKTCMNPPIINIQRPANNLKSTFIILSKNSNIACNQEVH